MNVGVCRYLGDMRLLLSWVLLAAFAAISYFVMTPLAQSWSDAQVGNFSLQEPSSFGMLFASSVAVPFFSWIIPLMCLGAGIEVAVNRGRTRR